MNNGAYCLQTDNQVLHFCKNDTDADDRIYHFREEDGLKLFSGYGYAELKENGVVKLLGDTMTFASLRLHFSGSHYFAADGGILRTISKQGKIQRIDTLFKDKEIICIAPGLSNKSLWIGTRLGLFELNLDTYQIINRLFPTEQITGVIRDHEDGLWISSLDRGTFYLPSILNKVKKITDFETGPLFETDSLEILTSGQNQSWKVKIQGAVPWQNLALENNNFVQDIIGNQDTLIWRLDRWLLVYIDGQLHHSRLYSRDIDWRDGEIYLVNSERIHRFSFEEFQKTFDLPYDDPKIISFYEASLETLENVRSIYLEKDNVWLGLKDGFGRLIAGEVEILKKMPRVTHIAQSQEMTWVGTNGEGLYGWNEKDTVNFSSLDGVSDFVKKLHIDRRGIIWVITSTGIYQLQKIKERYQLIPSLYAYWFRTTKIKDVLVDREETLWVSTESGLFAIENIYEEKEDYDTEIVLTEFWLNDELASVPSDLRLAYDENHLGFKFRETTFAAKQALKYRLNEGEWYPATTNFIDFPELSPGSFDLEVKGTNAKQVFAMTFTVYPPFWKSWWFIGLLLLAISALIYLFFRIRVLTYNRDVLRELIQLIIARLKREKYISLKDVRDGSQTKILLREILWIKGAKDYVEITTGKKQALLTKSTMKAILIRLNEIDPHFIRLHQSYIVNSQKVSAIHRTFLKIGEEKIPIGRVYQNEVQSYFDDFKK